MNSAFPGILFHKGQRFQSNMMDMIKIELTSYVTTAGSESGIRTLE